MRKYYCSNWQDACKTKQKIGHHKSRLNFFFSVPIDQLESAGTEHDAMNDYFRLFTTNSQMNSLFSSGITYEDFLGGAYFQAFDLTTSQEPGLHYAIPSVRVGKNKFLL